MRHTLIKSTSIALALTALAACSEAEYGESSSSEAQVDLAEEAMADTHTGSPGELSALGSRPEIPITLPQMAYVYDYGFRLPGKSIAVLQQKHADM